MSRCEAVAQCSILLYEPFPKSQLVKPMFYVKLPKISGNIKVFPFFAKKAENDGLQSAGNKRRTC
jgi:hypothetical protein